MSWLKLINITNFKHAETHNQQWVSNVQWYWNAYSKFGKEFKRSNSTCTAHNFTVKGSFFRNVIVLFSQRSLSETVLQCLFAGFVLLLVDIFCSQIYVSKCQITVPIWEMITSVNSLGDCLLIKKRQKGRKGSLHSKSNWF